MPPFSRSWPAEALEARIAPALFLLQPTGIYKVSVGGLVDASNSDLSGFAESGLAAVLNKGDRLALDLDGDGTLTPNSPEVTMIEVEAGRVAVFLTDIDGIAGFGAGDLTGLGLGGGVKATVNADVHGSIVTALNEREIGDFMHTPRNVARLTIHGRVQGHLLVSGSISNLEIQSNAATETTSIDKILTGAEVFSEEFSWNGGTTTFSLGDLWAAPFGYTSISKVTLSHGARVIAAGGNAVGAGGSISHVKIARQQDGLSVKAGSGADSLARVGAAGGSISDVFIGGFMDFGWASFEAGNGGAGRTRSGPGGNVSDIIIACPDTALDSFLFRAGNSGGLEVPLDHFALAGARGGSVVNVQVLCKSARDLYVTAGTGGLGADLYLGEIGARAPFPTPGGDGGSISKVLVRALEQVNSLSLTAGDGNFGSTGLQAGQGGSVSGITATKVNLVSAVGGRSGGFAGKGGSILHLNAELIGEDARLRLNGGGGGIGPRSSGGNIQDVQIQGSLSSIYLSAGDGGSAEGIGTNAAGGAGGSVSDIRIDSSGSNYVTIQAGAGGSGGSRMILGNSGDPYGGDARIVGARGGQGGSVHDITLQALAGASTPDSVYLTSGNGGAGSEGRAGGSAGNIAHLTLDHLYGFGASTGTGGSGGVAGQGGQISDLTLDFPGAASGLSLYTGEGGKGSKQAGAGGSIANVTVTGASFDGISLTTSKGADAEDETSARAGHGGDLRNLRFTVDAVKTFTVSAGHGGRGGVRNGDLSGPYEQDQAVASPGGRGGTISSLSITTLLAAGEPAAIEIVAGTGGSGAWTKAGGAGGTVRGLKVALAGDVTRFSVAGGTGGSGGNVNYKAVGGHGGTVTDVTLKITGQVLNSVGIFAGEGGDGPRRFGIGGSIIHADLEAGAPFVPQLVVGGGEPQGRLVDIVILPPLVS